MSDRLTELQRQRALLQQHLAWIEREIATEAAQSGAPVHLSPPTPTAAPAPTSSVTAAQPDAEAILSQYRSEPASLHENVRKGCFLYFALAFLLVGLAVTALYLYTRSRH